MGQPQSILERRRPQPECVPLDVLYEDECIIAVNKPAGMVVHPTYKNTSGTLLNGLLWRLRGSPNTQPGIVTRLDKNTSGLVLAGRTGEMHTRIQRDLAAGRVRKVYLALVHTTPEPASGTIALPLARDPADRRRVIVTDSGAAAESRYEVLASHEGWTLLRIELITGRTHQIRVHLASQGWPIMGDRTYGSVHASIARQALHAWRVTLPHPTSRDPLSIEAPLPPDMRGLLRSLPGTQDLTL